MEFEETSVVNEDANTKPALAWVMARVWPAIVSVPVRVGPALASKVNSTLVLPTPLAVVTCNQESLAVAVHVPPA